MTKVPSSILEEIELLQIISKPCLPSLVCFQEYYIDKNMLYIVMDLIKGDTLLDFSNKNRSKDNFSQNLLAIIIDIVPAIQYIHSHRLIHRDIKPENIMIDYTMQPKLIDIGLGCMVKKECQMKHKHYECCNGTVGTPLFMAPETLLYGKSYYSSDIFSLGATIYFVYKNKGLFSETPKTYKEIKIKTSSQEYIPFKSNSVLLDELINSMIIKYPEKRITSVGIMNKLFYLSTILKQK